MNLKVISVSVHNSDRRTGCRVPFAIALAVCVFTTGIAVVGYKPSGRALGRSVVRKIGQNSRSAAAVTPASVPPVTRFYAATSFWNSPIVSNPPIDANSANIISSSILPYATTATLNNTDWGIAFVVGSPTDPVYNVTCTTYCDQGTSFSLHIPAGTQPSTGSDHHLIVRNGNTEYDMWVASYNASHNTWSAYAVNYTSITGWGAECTPGQHCNSAVAAGFAGMGGVIRPEEIQQGHIDHALSLVIPRAKAGYIACPATHTDGNNTEPYAIPEGALLQLDPSFDVDTQSWLPWQKVVAKAMQVYGAYVSDQGAGIAWYGQTDQNPGNVPWASVGVVNISGRTFPDFPWSSVRVIPIQLCN